MKLSLKGKAFLLIGIPFILQVGILFWMSNLLDAANKATIREVNAKVFYVHSNYSTALVAMTTLSALGYILTGDPECLEEYKEFADRTHEEFKTMGELVKRPEQVAKVKQAEVLFQTVQSLLGVSGGKRVAVTSLDVEELKSTLRQALRLRREIMTSEYGSLSQTRETLPRAQQRSKWVIIVFLFSTAALAFVTTVIFIRSVLTRLGTIHGNTKLLSENRPLEPVVKGNDEITDVDLSFHEMANLLAESNRKERALIDNATSVLASLDREMRFIKVSQVCQKAWGYEVSELVGTNFARLLSGENDYEQSEFDQLVLSDERKTFDRKLIRADGKEIDVRFDFHWSPSESSFFCVATDVTKEKELERIKQQLLDTVAHDLRSPMTSIRTTLNLIRMGVIGEIPDAVQKRIERVEIQSDRLIRLINDLLDFERLESGSMTLFIQPIETARIVMDSIEAVAAVAAQSNVELEKQVQELVFNGDQDRLVQVLINLVSNAVKFSPEGKSVVISVSDEETQVRFAVTDSGPGVPVEFQAKIFERFRMIEGSADHKKAGSGLGLAICRQIVDLHGGEIGVGNNEGRAGSTFWFTVPTTLKTTGS